MLDKAVMRLSGIHKLLGLLAGLDVLQAIFIIGQAYYLSLSITGLWEGQKLSSQTVYILLFMFSRDNNCFLAKFRSSIILSSCPTPFEIRIEL